MKYDPEIFRNQFPIAKEFVFHLTYYRALHKAYSESGLKSEFWKYTIDSHLLQAAIKWCKVFGSHSHNETHWKKLNPDDEKEIRDCFIDSLNKSQGIDLKQWEVYWKEMTDFRNKYVAHTEIGFTAPVPDFTKAMNIVLFYDTWIRKIISPDYLAEGSLKLFSENLAKKIEQPLKHLVIGTAKKLNGI